MPARRGRTGLALVATAFALTWLVALLGPSPAVHPLPGSGLPLTLGLRPSGWLVTGLLAVAVAAGAVGVLLTGSALGRGWAPDPRRLLAGGLVAIAAFPLVPPVTSDDVFSYAAYGRMAVVGLDPYSTTPEQLGGPVGDAVGDPWRRTPSIYGPVATAQQALVMRVAGTSVRTGVWLLSLLGAAAAAATALLLHRALDGDAARRRAALLFGLNPLVVVPLVAGAHVDALLVLAIAAGVLLARRNAAAAGLVLGAAVAVKLTAVLAVLGVAWWLRHRPWRAVALLAGAAVVALPAYVAAGGWAATEQARRASRFVSFATPWRRLTEWLDDTLLPPASRNLVAVLAVAVIAALAVLLARSLPAPALPAPARTTLVPVLAWLLAATYVLPWYDAAAWVLLALLARSRWDELLLAHTAMLSLAYLPGRTVPMAASLASVTSATRRVVAPIVLGALLVAAVRLGTRRAPRPAGGQNDQAIP